MIILSIRTSVNSSCGKNVAKYITE